jgi:hypothetical protein
MESTPADVLLLEIVRWGLQFLLNSEFYGNKRGPSA